MPKCRDNDVGIFDAYICTMTLQTLHINTEHAGAIYALAYDSRKDCIYSGGADGVVAAWSKDFKTQIPFSIRTNASIYSLLFVEKYETLFIGLNNGRMHVIDVRSKMEFETVQMHQAGIFDLTYDPFHDWVWSCGGEGKINIWTAARGQNVRSIPFAANKIRQLAIHPTLPLMAVAGSHLWIIDTDMANTLDSLEAHVTGSTAVCWHPSKNILFSGGKDALLKAWQWQGELKRIVEIPAHRFAIYKIGIDHGNGVIWTAARDAAIKAWSIDDLSHKVTATKSSKGHTHSINAMIIDGDALYTGGDDRRLIHWQVSTHVGV
jgi:WD repeat-containing protein 61